MRIVFLVVIIVFGLTGCRSVGSIYEQEDLVTIAHNNVSDYTLLVYQDTRGRTRKVIRRKGICEMMLVEVGAGEYLFKERGRDARVVMGENVVNIETYIEELIYRPATMADKTSTEGSVF